jgi:hypothetical protein
LTFANGADDRDDPDQLPAERERDADRDALHGVPWQRPSGDFVIGRSRRSPDWPTSWPH